MRLACLVLLAACGSKPAAPLAGDAAPLPGPVADAGARTRDAGAAGQLWKDPAGHFVVAFPGEPSTQTSTAPPSDLGETSTSTNYSLQDGQYTYMASVTQLGNTDPDVPRRAEAIARTGPDPYLDSARDGMISKTGAKVLREDKITFEGLPGRELTVEVDGKPVTLRASIRIFLAKDGSLAYIAACFVPVAGDLAVCQRFTQSFSQLR